MHTNLVRGSIKPDIMVKIACKTNNHNDSYFGLNEIGRYIYQDIRHNTYLLFFESANSDKNKIVVFLNYF